MSLETTNDEKKECPYCKKMFSDNGGNLRKHISVCKTRKKLEQEQSIKMIRDEYEEKLKKMELEIYQKELIIKNLKDCIINMYKPTTFDSDQFEAITKQQ